MFDDVHSLILETAEMAARQAGELLRQKWQQPRQVQVKGFRDWVTDADREAQELITGIIRQRFPKHAFVTEEDDRSLPTQGPVYWIIDPVDGTSNYSRQIPIYSVAIAAAVADTDRVARYGRVVAGVVYDPARDELFSAALGQGSHCNGRPLQISTTSTLAESIVGFDWSRQEALRQKTSAIVDRLAAQAHTIRALGSAALGLAWVAAGRLDGYFNLAVGPWDGAAASLLIQEAGGRMDNLAAQPWRPTHGNCLASNGPLQSILATYLRSE